jgi:hypothetical protein
LNSRQKHIDTLVALFIGSHRFHTLKVSLIKPVINPPESGRSPARDPPRVSSTSEADCSASPYFSQELARIFKNSCTTSFGSW